MTFPVRGLTVGFFLYASLAWGKKPEAPQESELGKGMALFVNGDLRGALGHFNQALTEAHSGTETAKIHLLRAQCFMAMSDEPDARHAFELALDQDPDAQLDPNQVPPETVDLLSKVRTSLHAELTLLGEGGAALLDHQSLGPLPIHQNIPIGHHELEILNADHSFDQHEALLARPGDSVVLRFDLPRSPAATAAPSAPALSGTTGSKSSPAVSSPPLPPTAAATEPAPPSLLPFDVFGQVGVLGDPIGRGLAFEAGAGAGEGPLMASVTGLIGEAGGVVVRAGGHLDDLVGPLGAFASAELPLFFAARTSVGVGVQAGIQGRWWLFEPYVSLGGQHFFSTPGTGYPDNYFLLGGGLRVHLP